MLWRHRRGFTRKLKGFETPIVITRTILNEIKLMRFSEDIHNLITEIVGVLQQFAEGYCLVTMTVKRLKKRFVINEICKIISIKS